MQKKSWVAAFAVMAGTSVAISQSVTKSSGGSVDDPLPASAVTRPISTPTPTPEPAAPKNGFSTPLVKLSLGIAGLERGGCDVEVKPGNAGCRFRPTPMIHVDSKGFANIALRDVSIRGTDRMLSVAITIRESGQRLKTIYRAYRIPAGSATAPEVACYVSSPSKVARLDDGQSRKQ